MANEPPVSTSVVPPDQPPAKDPLRNSRVSRLWVGLIAFALLLILLIIFIAENTNRVKVTYFGASHQLPLAVAMLLSAVAGVLLMAIAGTLRIFQLRRRVRSQQKQQKRERSGKS